MSTTKNETRQQIPKISSLISFASKPSISDLKQSNFDHLNTDIHSLKTRYSDLKKIQIRISYALSNSHERALYKAGLAMNSCSRELFKTDSGYTTRSRCKLRTCPLCNAINQRKQCFILSKALDQLKFTLLDDSTEDIQENKKIIGLKVGLNTGKAPLIIDLSTRFKILHKAWSDLLRTKLLKDECLGSFRATEVTESEAGRANPHLHGTLLLRASCNISEVKNHINRYWRQAIIRETNKAKKQLIEHSTDTSMSVFSTESLYRHTASDLLEWSRYCFKRSYDFSKESHKESALNSTNEFWQEATKATKGLRLIAYSGILKEAVALAKEVIKENQEHTRTYETLSKPDFAWSDIDEKYINYEDYNPAKHDRVNPLTQNLSHLKTHPHLWELNQSELEEHKKRIKKSKIHSILKKAGLRLESYALDEIINDLSSCFFINLKSSNDDDEKSKSHFSEPSEIDRSALKNN